MTIGEMGSRRRASRARLSVEALEGREAPGGWGAWDCGLLSSGRGSCSNFSDASCNSRGHQDGGNDDRSCGPTITNTKCDGGSRSSHDSCKPKPATCQPPVAATGQVGGFVYVDLNRDGTFSTGEPILPGVAVVLTGTTSSGAAINAVATTDVNGAYSFGSLAAGNYTISITPPDGYVTGHSNADGTFGGTPGVNTVTGIAVPAGQSSVGYNFGVENPTPN